MKILLDTNVLIAAFISRGSCAELLEHCAPHHHVVICPFILSEFREKMTDKFGFSQNEADEAARLLKSQFEIVEPDGQPPSLCRDADDDHVIAAAIASACDCIVTGDNDLLDLREIQGIKQLSPSAFWANERD